LLTLLRRPTSTPFPYTTLFRSSRQGVGERRLIDAALLRSSEARRLDGDTAALREVYERPGKLFARDKEHRITGPSGLVETVMDLDRKSTRLNSSHVKISYAVFC